MNQLLPMIARSLVAAATFSAVALTAQAQGLTGNADAGQKKADMCIGCHGIPGYQNSFPEIHKVPKISGQSDKYIISALTAYKKGERKHPSMRGIAGSLSEQDMADLGAFYASQASKTAAETPKAPDQVTQALIEKGASTPTTCSWPSRPTRSRATRWWVAPTPSWPAWPSSSRPPKCARSPSTWLRSTANCRWCRSRASADCCKLKNGRSLSGFFVSVFRRPAAHLVDVGLAVGRSAGALAFPEHGAQALHHLVVRRVQIAASRGQELHRLADARWLVDAALLADGEVHGQVQERVLSV